MPCNTETPVPHRQSGETPAQAGSLSSIMRGVGKFQGSAGGWDWEVPERPPPTQTLPPEPLSTPDGQLMCLT